ncbi:MAG TPA: type II toxin-antitoxin system ParD family antitoxin [Humisphaera sp.]|nr:type II toxin-antitoxin system ParD family antitoxin [Humisphaera sp.]
MPVDLQPDTLRRIEDRVGAGHYGSADAVVRAGLDLLEQRERQRQSDIQAVRQKIDLGIREFERGEGFDGEQAFEELLASLNEDGSQP